MHGRKRMPISHKCDLLKGALFVLACTFLQRSTDASRMYHSVRGQDTLKLYVIFNVLEVRSSSPHIMRVDLTAFCRSVIGCVAPLDKTCSIRCSRFQRLGCDRMEQDHICVRQYCLLFASSTLVSRSWSLKNHCLADDSSRPHACPILSARHA